MHDKLQLPAIQQSPRLAAQKVPLKSPGQGGEPEASLEITPSN